jgi:heme-degrading monooxygenase HmoA
MKIQDPSWRNVVVPAMPWKSFAAPEGDREYTAMVSYLPLNKFRALPKFMKYTFQVRRQLAGSEGLIGYSMDANVVGKEFWTLSVWEDAEALRRFVHRDPHDEVMRDLLPDMGQTEFVRWKASGSSVAPAWEAAKERIRERQA